MGRRASGCDSFPSTRVEQTKSYISSLLVLFLFPMLRFGRDAAFPGGRFSVACDCAAAARPGCADPSSGEGAGHGSQQRMLQELRQKAPLGRDVAGHRHLCGGRFPRGDVQLGACPGSRHCLGCRCIGGSGGRNIGVLLPQLQPLAEAASVGAVRHGRSASLNRIVRRRIADAHRR